MTSMENRNINPWSWQDQFGFSQAIEVSNHTRTLYCAGQTSVDADGHPMHPGNMSAQLAQAMDNLETVLEQAGFALANVVRLNVHTTDMDKTLGSYGEVVGRLSAAGCQPAMMLLGTSRLAFPDLLVEIEATAVA
jgi:enamine deaminase RidA (YjgF/YER057c/UK114 family)